MLQRLTIFCSARDLNSRFTSDLMELAKFLVHQKIEVIYGGGGCGLMREVADHVLGFGGVVRGVIPKSLVQTEHAHDGLQELIVVEDLMERKRRLMEMGDAFLILPGGIGTLDELMEVLTWKILKSLPKPIFIWNPQGFWDPLLTLFEHLQEEKALDSVTLDQFQVVSTIRDLIHLLK